MIQAYSSTQLALPLLKALTKLVRVLVCSYYYWPTDFDSGKELANGYTVL